MSNTYGISEQVERAIRARDKACVYCGILMKQSPHARRASGTTIEHFNNDGPLKEKYNVAICCRRCNSSKGTKSLAACFKTPYCCEKKITAETVSKPVKEYIRLEKRS
jgi:5-methylcytosine-specific restriction endonuclease McrA